MLHIQFTDFNHNNRPHFTKDHITVCKGCKAVLRNTRQLAINFYHNGSAAGLATPSSATTFNF